MIVDSSTHHMPPVQLTTTHPNCTCCLPKLPAAAPPMLSAAPAAAPTCTGLLPPPDHGRSPAHAFCRTSFSMAG
jgi:hypothetical protein